MPKKIMQYSIIRCPICKFKKQEAMPADSCFNFYICNECGARLKPKPGDCCVFSSFGDEPCQPVQDGLKEGCAALKNRA